MIVTILLTLTLTPSLTLTEAAAIQASPMHLPHKNPNLNLPCRSFLTPTYTNLKTNRNPMRTPSQY